MAEITVIGAHQIKLSKIGDKYIDIFYVLFTISALFIELLCDNFACNKCITTVQQLHYDEFEIDSFTDEPQIVIFCNMLQLLEVFYKNF